MFLRGQGEEKQYKAEALLARFKIACVMGDPRVEIRNDTGARSGVVCA